MTVLRITETSTRADIERAITALRAQQLATSVESLKTEKQVAIDALVDKWERAPE